MPQIKNLSEMCKYGRLLAVIAQSYLITGGPVNQNVSIQNQKMFLMPIPAPCSGVTE